MSISLWRLVHLWIAIISSVFILIASVTGAILSFEPIYEYSFSYKTEDADALPLVEVLNTVKSTHEEVLSMSRDENGFVLLSTFEEDRPFYINPFTGEKIGELFETPEIFEFCRTLHRSLFLGQLGRFLIGITAVFLLFISISGVWLILKKQGGWKKAFTPVVKNDFFQDYHTRLGRLLLISLIIIATTGTYLFLERFEVIPKDLQEHNIDGISISEDLKEVLPFSDYNALQDIPLSDMREIVFPFAEDPEEFFEFKLSNREIMVDQFSGEIVSQIDYPLVQMLSLLSFKLHTGEGTVIWALILGISGISLLFFMYSGFAIYFRRRKVKQVNRFEKHESSIVIAVGSEQGSTVRFANALNKALISNGHASYIAKMNEYESYTNMQYLFILTSTYGLGEAPASANKFIDRFEQASHAKDFNYAVLGFGSTAYPDFCQFAIEVNELLSGCSLANELLPLHKVDRSSKSSFMEWVTALGHSLDETISVSDKDLGAPKPKLFNFETTQKKYSLNPEDHTFILRLKCSHRAISKYQSGDLLVVIPESDPVERLYSMSIDKANKTVLLSIRRHKEGICSTYLSSLEKGQKMKAYFKSNPDFNFSEESVGTIMISNGTGIAPFLGMIDENRNKRPISLFWGGQNKDSYALFGDHIEELQSSGKLRECKVAFSREGVQKQYVQDIVEKELEGIIHSLDHGYDIMICGAISMQTAVERLLDKGCQEQLGKPLDHFKKHGLIKTDCY